MNRVILGVLALFAITLGSGLGAEDSQDKALASDRYYEGELADLNPQSALQRRAREAAKNGKNKKGKKKNGKKKNGAKKFSKNGKKPKRKGGKRKIGKKKSKKQSKGKKSGKRGKQGKKNKKRKKGKKGKGRKKGKKGAAKSGKKPNQERQADAPTTPAAGTEDCSADWIKAGVLSRKYANSIKQITRMLRKSDLAKGKAKKAKTTFDKAKMAIRGATLDCTACVGNRSEQEEAIKTCNTLSNCSTSAADWCEAAVLKDDPTQALCEKCNNTFQEWQSKYQTALTSQSCSDIKNLPSVDNCDKSDWAAFDKSHQKLFKKCVKSSTPGSFGDCRKNERMAAYLSYDCVECTDTFNAVVTTASTGRRQKRLSQFSNLLNRNF